MELELADESSPILFVIFSLPPVRSVIMSFSFRYRVGETFVHLSPGAALKRVARDAEVLDSEISKMASDAESCEEEMKQLKVSLYAKFGSAINLDE